MKTKVGGLTVEEDVRRVRALREAIGPDVRLMVDANEAYNATTAIRIGQAVPSSTQRGSKSRSTHRI